MRPDGPRDPIAGPDSGPEPPFPIKLSGPVIKGFGRGSKELGIPTANIPPGPLDQHPDLSTGVYYGLVGLLLPATNHNEQTSTSSSAPLPQPANSNSTISTHPAVLSIGYNPFYANKTRSIEIHILPKTDPNLSTGDKSQSFSPAALPEDFYGAPLNLLILGFIRPEYDYISKEALIEDIMTDCQVARASLGRETYQRYDGDGEWGRWLRDFGWVEKDGKWGWEGRVQEVEREVGVRGSGSNE